MFEDISKDDSTLEIDETREMNSNKELLKHLSASDEQMYRNILYFSTFEEIPFRMNGLKVSNLFGEQPDVLE